MDQFLGAAALAEAKVNLSLRVIGRRPDGYHELYGLMARLSLADALFFSRADGSSDTLSYECELESPLAGSLDNGFKGENNLALKALRSFRKLTGEPKVPLNIHIVKRIPLSAGLGGGSSDACSVLRFLNQSGLLSDSDLKALALSLGGDVPFFLEKSPRCLAGGVGEVLQPFDGQVPGTHVLLVNPGFALSTAEVFQQLSLTISAKSSNSLNADLRATFGPGLAPLFGQNDLFPGALRLCPALEKVQAAIAKLIPSPLVYGLSGSGPTFWALYATLQEAQRAGQNAAEQAKNKWWIKTAVLV
jgi:4-diphosphocytidyl-2-C-methyl-D-erythritol kinase